VKEKTKTWLWGKKKRGGKSFGGDALKTGRPAKRRGEKVIPADKGEGERGNKKKSTKAKERGHMKETGANPNGKLNYQDLFQMGQTPHLENFGKKQDGYMGMAKKIGGSATAIGRGGEKGAGGSKGK